MHSDLYSATEKEEQLGHLALVLGVQGSLRNINKALIEQWP